MNLFDFQFLADENIHNDVVLFLREQGCDVKTLRDCDLIGATDIDLVRFAVASDRVILTHDSDFGTLAIAAGEPMVGTVYLRPGHIDPDHTISTLRSVIGQRLDIQPPFILVARRLDEHVFIRLRQL